MQQASKYSLLIDNPEEVCDTNILFLNFDSMKSWKASSSTSDPMPCENCLSVLSSFDKLSNFKEITEISSEVPVSKIKPKVISPFNLSQIPNKTKKKVPPTKKKPIIQIEDSEDEKDSDPESTPKAILWRKKEIKTEIKPSEQRGNNHTSYWKCEFCGHINDFINLKAEEIPKIPDIFYLLLNRSHLQSMDFDPNNDISVIFCLDNSGSMSSSLEVQAGLQGQTPGNLNEQELEMIKNAISPEEYQEQLRNLQNPMQRAHITRKNCIIKAIQKELTKMKEEFPHRKVGIVIFNDDVLIAGDGQSPSKLISGGNLLDYHKCLQIGIDSAYMMNQHIVQNSNTVINSYTKSPEKGKTALGPALAASVGLASCGKPGSMVVLCTDGLANVGIGDLTISDVNQNKVYEKISDFAKDAGININVITIAGEQCRTEILGRLVEKTNGNLERVNPTVISNEIREMLNDNILGRNAIITMYLPMYLRFIHEEPDSLSEGGSVCRKEVGNISENTKVSYRFKVKNYVFERRKKNFKENMKVNFQAQIKYLSLEGIELLRVISATFQATFTEETAFLNGNVALIANHAATEIAILHNEKREGDLLERQNKWNNLMEIIRETKRKKNALRQGDEESIKSFRRDTNMMEELTIKQRKRQNRKPKQKMVEEVDELSEEERTLVYRLKKKNYK